MSPIGSPLPGDISPHTVGSGSGSGGQGSPLDHTSPFSGSSRNALEKLLKFQLRFYFYH